MTSHPRVLSIVGLLAACLLLTLPANVAAQGGPSNGSTTTAPGAGDHGDEVDSVTYDLVSLDRGEWSARLFFRAEMAYGLRSEADEDGNGHVDEGEAEAYEASLMESVEDEEDEEDEPPTVTLDGRAYTEGSQQGAVAGLEGAVERSEPVVWDLSASNTVEPGDGSKHTFKVDADAMPEFLDKTRVKILIPSGYGIEDTQGIETTDACTAETTVESQRRDLVVVFSEQADEPCTRGVNPSPGPGILLALGALAGATGLLGRLRRPG